MMTTAKHTAGPWQVKNELDETIVVGNVDGESFSDGSSSFYYDFVCDTSVDDYGAPTDPDAAKANARLIAAAPDLLAMLKHAVHWHDQITPADVARYQAAINKAEVR